MNLIDTEVKSSRIRVIKEFDYSESEDRSITVAYWITRSNRMQSNWAFTYAYRLAESLKAKLLILKNIPDDLYYANRRTYNFYFDGLKEMVEEFESVNVPVNISEGKPEDNIPKLVEEFNIQHLITDFDVLKPNKKYKKAVFDKIEKIEKLAIYEIDSQNIVPCRIASDKREIGARTLRPKINKKLDEYLDIFPELQTFEHNTDYFKNKTSQDYSSISKKYDDGPEVPEKYKPGRKAGLSVLEKFVDSKLNGYADKRNDPANDYLSDLSIYINHGWVSRQEIAKRIRAAINQHNNEDSDSFLEELIVRAELAENFCHYCEDYDSPKCFPGWSKESLEKHSADKRDHLYSLEELENSKTHDPAWNACQTQLVVEGKMHGYMRMYWAKKILEWTENHEVAHDYAIHLNDKYELDGRDPNGYTGVAWAIGGVHDQGWKEREIFGKVRYMNYKGLKRKFNIEEYEKRYNTYKK